MAKGNDKKRKMMIFYIVGIILIIALNFILSKRLARGEVKEVSYSEFLEMIDKDQVDIIKEEKNLYKFTTKEKDKKVNYYTVGKWNDPSLIERLEKNNVKFSAYIPEEINPIIYFLLTLVGPILLFYFIGRLLMKNISNIGGNSMSFGKANAKVYVKAQTGITFNDVAGQDEAKESLEEVVDFLHNPRKYNEIGAIGPKGVLLVGPPGTGKTLLAKAVAGESDVPFFSISGPEFVEMFVGLGASKVRDLFKQAKEKAPCIVFIDEIDAIGKKRDVSGYSGNDEREQTLNQLLNEMDGFDGSEGVVILAATNRPEVLDPALVRPGRFDRQIRVELPDIKGREEILEVHAKKIKLDKENVDLKQIAKMTAGSSGADLANIINEGALLAVRENRKLVRQSDLEESVEVVIAGQKKKNAVISEEERRIIAYHEVGHAIVAAKQKGTAPVTKITVIPRTSGALGYTMQVDEEEKVIMTKEQLISEIATLTGGRSAEELVFNTKTTGASNDIQKATKIARAIVTQFGMTDEFDFISLERNTNQYLGGDTQLLASSEVAGQIDRKVKEIISIAHNRAIEILKENMDKMHEIARYLLEKETITGEEFMAILNSKYDELEELEKKLAKSE